MLVCLFLETIGKVFHQLVRLFPIMDFHHITLCLSIVWVLVSRSSLYSRNTQKETNKIAMKNNRTQRIQYSTLLKGNNFCVGWSEMWSNRGIRTIEGKSWENVFISKKSCWVDLIAHFAEEESLKRYLKWENIRKWNSNTMINWRKIRSVFIVSGNKKWNLQGN